MIDKIHSYVKSKCDSYEIYLNNYDTDSFEIVDTKLGFVSQGSLQGLGIRVEKNKKIGFSSTSDAENFKECVNNAVKISRLNKKDNNFVKFASPGKYLNVKSFDKKISMWGTYEINKFINDIISSVKENNAKVIRGNYSRQLNRINIINSEGVDVYEKTSSNSIYYQLLKNKISYDGGTCGREVLKPDLKKDLGMLHKLRKKGTAPTKNMKVILGPEALSCMIDTLFGENLNAFNVQKQQSSFTKKLGEKLFSGKFSLTDDGTKGSNCSRSDDEGTPSKNKVIFDKGKLKQFLYDSYSANIEKFKSTGNGFRSYSSTPSIGFSNVYVKKGNKSFNKLVSNDDEVVYVDDMMGYHTCNSFTGDFSLSITNGFYIRKGEIKFALKNSMLVGNFFEMLNNILSVENKQHHFYSFYVPSVLFESAKVIGG